MTLHVHIAYEVNQWIEICIDVESWKYIITLWAVITLSEKNKKNDSICKLSIYIEILSNELNEI